MTYDKKILQPGFSMMELMISLGIILLILGLVAPNLSRLLGKGDRASVKNTLKIVNQAILEYKMDVRTLPKSLSALDKRPEDVSGWNGSYLPESMQGKQIVDVWGQPIVYKINEPGKRPAYQLYSVGDPEKEDDRIDADK